MIFPDLPRTPQFQPPVLAAQPVEPEPEAVSTPVSADEWFRRHFPDDSVPVTQPEYTVSAGQALRERIEFAVICIGMVIWAAYWHQFQ